MREGELKGSTRLKCRMSDLLMSLLLRATFALLFIRDVSALLTPTSFTSSGKPHYTVPPGTRIARSSSTIDVFAANGTLLYTFDATAAPASGPTRRQDHAIHSAQAFFACGNASTQISSLNTSFVVPPAPETFDSQVFFLGPAVAGYNATTGEVLGTMQAALQYGGTGYQGGSFWSLFAFFDVPAVTLSTSITTTVKRTDTGLNPRTSAQSPINISPGTRLSASILYDPVGVTYPYLPPEPNRYWYQPVFDGFELTNTLTLEVSFDIDPTPVRALVLVQEEGVVNGTMYPPGKLVFEDVGLVLNYTEMTGGETGTEDIEWSVDVDLATQLAVNVLVDGAQGAQIEVVFPDS
ncbi:hypothetical protein HMN09_00454900 [Mycena chlorophos]|uniref:Uncharacterized protein n=1 Tax=Mycena chlorophos TaxID=658473 RepID=A0A8H6TK64_MYCCL|nr:hypothetical protein HMN09_00454900 [Mycena chlorophos]